MLTMSQVFTLVQGTYIYDSSSTNADGTPCRWLVTSVKTWKRDPDRYEVRLKHGLHIFARFGPSDIAWLYILCRSELEAIDQRNRVERFCGSADNPNNHILYFQDTHLGHIDSKHEITLEELTEFQLNLVNVKAIGFMVDREADQVWVCIDGVSVLRVKGIEHFLLTDCRTRATKKRSKEEAEKG